MSTVVLIVALAVPSLGQVAKYFGTGGAVAYVMFVVVAVVGGQRFIVPLLDRLTDRTSLRLAIATTIVLIAAFLIAFPYAQAGTRGGSDADDALDEAGRAFLRGDYPYYGRTYLGNILSPFPGALLLALPFVIAGTSGLQGPFWLLLFFFFVRRLLGDARLALLIMWAMVALSPAVLQELMVGTDRMANAIYILIPATMLLGRPSASWAVLLGIALSSRPNFLFLIPLIFAGLVRRAGIKAAVQLTLLVCAATAAVTLPFYLYDPGGFSPLQNVDVKLDEFQSGIPFISVLIPLCGFGSAIVLALSSDSSAWRDFLRNAAIVQAIPVAIVVALEIWGGAGPFPTSLNYGLQSLPFAVLAAHTGFTKDRKNDVARLSAKA